MRTRTSGPCSVCSGTETSRRRRATSARMSRTCAPRCKRSKRHNRDALEPLAQFRHRSAKSRKISLLNQLLIEHLPTSPKAPALPDSAASHPKVERVLFVRDTRNDWGRMAGSLRSGPPLPGETQGRNHPVYKYYFCRFYRPDGDRSWSTRARTCPKGSSLALTSQAGGNLAKGSVKIEGETGRIDGRQANDHDQRRDQTIFDCRDTRGVLDKPLKKDHHWQAPLGFDHAQRRIKSLIEA